jgi:hypothetical protein
LFDAADSGMAMPALLHPLEITLQFFVPMACQWANNLEDYGNASDSQSNVQVGVSTHVYSNLLHSLVLF